MIRSMLLALLLVLTSGPALAQNASQPFRSDRIVIETRGPARPSGGDVILIPGIASTGEVWRRTADRLDDRHRVHIVTVRGFGSVPAGANATGPVVRPVAREIARYIASARLDHPALIGHSMGGLIALEVAADRGAGISRLMVVDGAPFFPSLVSAQARAADVEPIARIAYQALLVLGDQALRDGGNALGLDLGGAGDAVFDGVGWQGGNRATLAQSLYEVMTLDLRPRLPAITAPVTVVYGWSTDDASPRAHVDGLFRQSFAALPRPARFDRIEGAEHMVMVDRPIQFMAVVERFLGG